MNSAQGLANAADLDFDTAWGELASAFLQIHTKNASSLSFEQLYRNAYKLVLKKKGEELYFKVADFEREWLGGEVRASIYKLLAGTLLLNDTDQIVGGSATALERREAGMRLLNGLKQAWTDHQVAMAMLTDVLMYMVRNSSLLPCWLALTRYCTRIASTVRTRNNSPSLQKQ